MPLPIRTLYATSANHDPEAAARFQSFSPDQPLQLPSFAAIPQSQQQGNASFLYGAAAQHPSNLQPTEDELAAIQSLARLGDTVDQDLAVEFLRGFQFGECSGVSTAADRSLPALAVGTLKLWFLVHQDDPYPTREQKVKLMKETGLSHVQLKNWFSNIRKRHWHPIRTGSRRPRSHVEYILLMGSTKMSRSAPAVLTSVPPQLPGPIAFPSLEHQATPRIRKQPRVRYESTSSSSSYTSDF